MPSNPVTDNGPHYARFSDGKSATANDATVTFGAKGLEVTVSSPYKRLNWPYKTLRSGEPLLSHAIDCLLSSSESADATLFVPGAEFAAKLKMHAPHLTARRATWRQARPWLTAAAAIVGVFTAATAMGWSPIRTIASLLPDTWRERLGEEAISSMTEGYKRCDGKDGLSALEQISTRLGAAAGVKKPFKIRVYDWSLMNAFAVPGGTIVVTKGLIDKAESPDEVAGVLSHEMGHGIEMHPETGIIRTIGLAAAVELMLGGSGGAISNIGLLLAQLGYTRAAEREADEIGLKLLKGASISAKGLGDFFKRIEHVERDDAEITRTLKGFDLLRSHPLTKERAEMVARQGAYPATPALSAAAWQALKSVCNVTIEPEKPKPDAE